MAQIQAPGKDERVSLAAKYDISAYKVVPRRYFGRYAAATLIAVLLIGLVQAFIHGNIEWSFVAQFLTAESIMFGLLNTITMSILAMALGVELGVVVAVMRMSQNPLLRYVAQSYTWLFRGTPLILQLLLWFNLALIFPTLGIPGLFEFKTVEVITPKTIPRTIASTAMMMVLSKPHIIAWDVRN